MRLSAKCLVSEEMFLNIIEDLARLGEFNKCLWTNKKVIFSQKLCDSLSELYDRRKNDCITIEILCTLLDNKCTLKLGLCPIHTNGNTQTKLNQIKPNIKEQIVGLEILQNPDDKLSKEEKAENFVLPTKEEILNFSLIKIEECIEILCHKIYDKKIWWEVYSFKGRNLKFNKNERAILHVLIAIYTAKNKPSNYWKYATAILSKEDQTYNERDNTKNSGG
jgi:hypothetical protein